MANKETVEENTQEVMHVIAIVYNVTIKEVSDKIARQVYDICVRMKDVEVKEPKVLKPKK